MPAPRPRRHLGLASHVYACLPLRIRSETMTDHPVHGRIDGPIVMIGFGSIGRGTLPLIERHFAYDRVEAHGHRPRRCRPRAAGRAGRALHPPGGDAGQLQAPARAAADGRPRPGLLRQPVGRHLVARPHGVLPRNRRALHRHGGRAVGRLLLRQVEGPGDRAPTTRCARRCWRRAAATPAARRPCPAAAPIPAWCPGSSSRRCSTSRAISASPATEPDEPRGVGQPRPDARRQGHPHRRARHAARQNCPSRGRCS